MMELQWVKIESVMSVQPCSATFIRLVYQVPVGNILELSGFINGSSWVICDQTLPALGIVLSRGDCLGVVLILDPPMIHGGSGWWKSIESHWLVFSSRSFYRFPRSRVSMIWSMKVPSTHQKSAASVDSSVDSVSWEWISPLLLGHLSTHRSRARTRM